MKICFCVCSTEDVCRSQNAADEFIAFGTMQLWKRTGQRGFALPGCIVTRVALGVALLQSSYPPPW